MIYLVFFVLFFFYITKPVATIYMIYINLYVHVCVCVGVCVRVCVCICIYIAKFVYVEKNDYNGLKKLNTKKNMQLY